MILKALPVAGLMPRPGARIASKCLKHRLCSRNTVVYGVVRTRPAQGVTLQRSVADSTPTVTSRIVEARKRSCDGGNIRRRDLSPMPKPIRTGKCSVKSALRTFNKEIHICHPHRIEHRRITADHIPPTSATCLEHEGT